MATSSKLLQAILGAAANRLEVLGGDIDAAVGQLNILKSAEEWLDLWGTVYGIPRRSDQELDDAYGARIIEETLRQRPQPQALTEIVFRTLGIQMVVKDLWTFVLQSDGFAVPAGRPAQVCDGHLTPGWIAGSVNDQVVRCGIVSPYLEGMIGFWLNVAPEVPFIYTLENVIQSQPLVLLSDQLDVGTLHVSDGQLTTPDFGGPGDTARHSFAVATTGVPASVGEVLSLLNRHRAAGTEIVFLGFY